MKGKPRTNQISSQHAIHSVKTIFPQVLFFSLGKKVEGKLRPLLVKVNSETIKRTIFGQLHKLGNMNDNNISMSHDMTKEERQRTKLLVDDAKMKTKEIKDDNTLDND